MSSTTGAMLQQNNNNNYPCLSMSDRTQEILQRCPRASLPFPSRVELGLGDLPLIRGLRAWALCSKSRRKAGGLLGGGKAPLAAPPGRASPTSCPRPADICPSGYRLPLGLDARQAGIGALVTVATLKTSEGGGKTQTQCLFLRTERGSCLYSTAKPGSGSSPGTVGEWLRGKQGGAGDAGGTNRVRVRSGRRWRKSGTAASQERPPRSSKKAEPRSEAWQEEQDKSGLNRSVSSETCPSEMGAGSKPNLEGKRERRSSDVDRGQEMKTAERLEDSHECLTRRDEDANAEQLNEPEKEPEDDTEPEKELESSLPVGGAARVNPKQESNQLGVELGPELEGVIEEPDVRGLQPEGDESNTANEETRKPQHEEKGVLCPPVRQRDPSVSEDECTCSEPDEVEGDASAGQKTFNPAPSLPPLASMATGLPCQEVEEEKGEKGEVASGHGGGTEQQRSARGELEGNADEARVSAVAPEDGRTEEEEEEEEDDEFGVFMQAEGAPAWSQGVNMSVSVPCGSRVSVAAGNQGISADDAWTAFPQDPSDESRDAAAGQWWPAGGAEARPDGPRTDHSLAAVFAEAFPAPPRHPPADLCDPEAVPTLTQLLRGKAHQDQGLLDSFHDLNKMIGQSHRRSSGASQSLLLKTLQLQQPLPESRPPCWASGRRLSPGHSSTNQHAAAKRRLSYDHNRNVTE